MPGECAPSPSEPAVITLTPRLWATITSVNRSVNGSIRAITDEEHWGVADRWDIPTDGAGDCEDFQLLKRKLLAEQGLPRRAMRMTVVIDEKGEGHAVLMIRTNRGDLILDNKTNAVQPWFRNRLCLREAREPGPGRLGVARRRDLAHRDGEPLTALT